ncbi:MAG: hypothetical protein C4338_06975 [Rhodanobacteraceae bacterium]
MRHCAAEERARHANGVFCTECLDVQTSKIEFGHKELDDGKALTRLDFSTIVSARTASCAWMMQRPALARERCAKSGNEH